jgi:hypothetical protein
MTTGAQPMSRAHRAYVIAMCAIIGGAFAYAACDWGHWPHLIYLPLSGKLVMRTTSAIAIHYAGLVLWGAGGACAGALAGAVLCRAVPRTWPPRVYRLLGAWAITALLLAGSYFTWSLWPW